MTEKHLQKLIINKENIFSLKREEFVKLFPVQYRKQEEVEHLNTAIREKQQDSIERVKENIKEAINKTSNNAEDFADTSCVLENMRQLQENLSKDVESLDEDIDVIKEMFLQYSEYLKRRTHQVLKSNESLPKINAEEQEFRSHLDMLKNSG